MLPILPTDTIKVYRDDLPATDDKEREASYLSRDDPETADEEDILPASRCSQFQTFRKLNIYKWLNLSWLLFSDF